MIPADLASRVRLLVEALVPPVRGTGEIGTDLPRMLPGQRFMAQILDILPDGNFRARVEGRTLTLALPDAATTGDTLELVVTARHGSTIQARLLAAAEIEPQAPDTQAGALARGDSRPILSQTGQLISQLLTGRFGEARPLPLVPGGRVLTSNPLDITATASALKQLVGQSGLFYESHLAQWMEGERPLQSLLAEPQNRAAPAQHQAATGHSPAATQTSAQASTNATDTPETILRAGSEVASRTAETTPPTATTASGALRVPEPLTPVVLQQLDTLASHQASWQGQVWPGAQMAWSLIDPDDGREGGDEEDVAVWRSHMRLLLPRLGELDARLALGPDGVRIQVEGADSESCSQLRDGLPALREAFEAAGIPLIQVTVSEHDGR